VVALVTVVLVCALPPYLLPTGGQIFPGSHVGIGIAAGGQILPGSQVGIGIAMGGQIFPGSHVGIGIAENRACDVANEAVAPAIHIPRISDLMAVFMTVVLPLQKLYLSNPVVVETSPHSWDYIC
jgi:hypothetical protein